MADTDDTQASDMNALLRDRDRAGLDAQRRARLFGTSDTDETGTTAAAEDSAGGDAA